jgi:hypothetical protein
MLSSRTQQVHHALEALGGRAHYVKIELEVIRGRRHRGEVVPPNISASVRNCLQRHCSTSQYYTGGPDLFRNPQPGIWELVGRKKPVPLPVELV